MKVFFLSVYTFSGFGLFSLISQNLSPFPIYKLSEDLPLPLGFMVSHLYLAHLSDQWFYEGKIHFLSDAEILAIKVSSEQQIWTPWNSFSSTPRESKGWYWLRWTIITSKTDWASDKCVWASRSLHKTHCFSPLF